MPSLERFLAGEDVRGITGKLNKLVDAVGKLEGISGDGRSIIVTKAGGVPTISAIPKPKGAASASSTTPWKLELDGANIKSTNAVAYWYGEQVLLATEQSPLTWTAPSLGASLYVDVSYSSGWSCVAATAAGSTAGHQYYLVGKYESDGTITQYQHGILRIGDRYQ